MEFVELPEPWDPGKATERIRAKAQSDSFGLSWSGHARDQMLERSLIVGDVLYILKNGMVYDRAEESTRIGLFKYKMISFTPNSARRDVAVIVIPSHNATSVKVVTVMWADEPMHSR